MNSDAQTALLVPPASLVELTHARVLFTTRNGGVSGGPFRSLNLGAYVGDEAAAVAENLDLLRRAAGLDRIRTVRQVHGAMILDVDVDSEDEGDSDAQDEAGVAKADGLVGTKAGEGLLVTVADCFPVALASASRVMMLHCGWRPLAAGIIERALDLLAGEAFEAAIGPGIGAGAYEVDEDVVSALGSTAKDHFRDGRLDLAGILREKLSSAHRIEQIHACTYENPGDYFSYRRDGAITGRQGGLIWRA